MSYQILSPTELTSCLSDRQATDAELQRSTEIPRGPTLENLRDSERIMNQRVIDIRKQISEREAVLGDLPVHRPPGGRDTAQGGFDAHCVAWVAWIDARWANRIPFEDTRGMSRTVESLAYNAVRCAREKFLGLVEKYKGDRRRARNTLAAKMLSNVRPCGDLPLGEINITDENLKKVKNLTPAQWLYMFFSHEVAKESGPSFTEEELDKYIAQSDYSFERLTQLRDWITDYMRPFAIEHLADNPCALSEKYDFRPLEPLDGWGPGLSRLHNETVETVAESLAPYNPESLAAAIESAFLDFFQNSTPQVIRQDRGEERRWIAWRNELAAMLEQGETNRYAIWTQAVDDFLWSDVDQRTVVVMLENVRLPNGATYLVGETAVLACSEAAKMLKDEVARLPRVGESLGAGQRLSADHTF